jgi:proline dehydrogenase
VRLLIDAEQSYLQPAIDLFAIELQRQFNSQQPVVYNTYQAYRKDGHQRYAFPHPTCVTQSGIL